MLTDFRGYWLASEVLRQGRKLKELERADPLLAARNRALDALDCDGVDLRDRRAVKRVLGRHGCVPDLCRGNRAAYEAFIDCVIETQTKCWASQGWLLEREGANQ